MSSESDLDLEKQFQIVEIYALYFMTRENTKEFQDIQRTIQSLDPSSKHNWTLLNLLLQAHEFLDLPFRVRRVRQNSKHEIQEWLNQWTTLAYSNNDHHSSHLCSLFIRLGIKSIELNVYSFQELELLWMFLKRNHGFNPSLRDYHVVLEYLCTRTTPTTSDTSTDRTQVKKEFKVKEWMLKLRGSGLVPTADTYSLLFYSCIDLHSMTDPMTDPMTNKTINTTIQNEIETKTNLLLEMENEMMSRGIPHSEKSISSLIACLFLVENYQLASTRLDLVRLNGQFTSNSILFYNTLLSAFRHSKETSEFAIKEFRFSMDRDVNAVANQETCRYLLDCCMKSLDYEAAHQIWKKYNVFCTEMDKDVLIKLKIIQPKE